MPVGAWTLGLVLGELVAQQSSGRHLAIPVLGIESTVAINPLVVLGGETQGTYVPRAASTIGEGAGGFAGALSAGVRIRRERVTGESLLGAGVRVRAASFGGYDAVAIAPVVRVRFTAGWQATQAVAVRGGVGGWVGTDALDLDATVGVAWCF